ncbi:putative imidazolonepropionase [Cichlidogyrus casuarinus]|uniref:Probable imidazolonepropionase n=1 Tax=Cichlidogyrus casuarinus TaxID=1844966 RepID=A0ABD2Q5N4_9PLAT
MSYRLLKNIKQIVQVASDDREYYVVENNQHIVVKFSESKTADLVIVIENATGNISAIGEESTVFQMYPEMTFSDVIDCKEGCVLPGFVDAHTHPVWAGDRVHEFADKLNGASYADIHKSGGGINFTVRHTKSADPDDLYESFVRRIRSMVKKGSTTIECKSGYGLDYETELRMLQLLTRGKRELPLDLSITYLAAHAVPAGMTSEQATNDIIDNQLPRLKQEIDSGKLLIDNVDVFCEKDIYDVRQTEAILRAGADLGLEMNFHADELTNQGGAELAGRLGARAASHLEEASPHGVALMAQGKTAAVLLPTTALICKLRPPSATAMIQAGVAVALGSDFNPNAYCCSMPLVMFLACTTFGMSLEQALVGATLNSAYSLKLSHRLGAITVGRQADLLICNCAKWEHLIYQLGETEELIEMVLKKGKVIFRRQDQFFAF